MFWGYNGLTGTKKQDAAGAGLNHGDEGGREIGSKWDVLKGSHARRGLDVVSGF